MKKSLIALAVLAASGTAMAQSSVTLFGIVDANVTHVNHATAAGKSMTGMGHSGNATSRLGFRGVEDLGGGLKAGFWLEGAVSNDDGNGTGAGAGPGFAFKRRSTVSLMGNFGEVRLGRDLVPSYTKVSSYDVFGQVGIGQFMGWNTWSQVSNLTPAAVAADNADANGFRQSNMLAYYTPNFGGFTAGLGYGLDERTAGGHAGRYMGGFVAYDNGPFSITGALDRRDVLYTNAFAPLADGKKDMYSLGVAYDAGMAKISAMAQQTRFKSIPTATGTTDNKVNAYLIGAAAPVGAGQFRIQYALYDQKAIDSKAHQLSLGYVHNLSKRTAVYGTLAHIRNKNNSNLALASTGVANAGPGVGNNQTGLSLGVRHSF
ncbi:porin [Melaminivora sp.]|uniref:porin n=1 Tax=Melaminivora sp. TaxID=1933032 RepID=UPI0028AD14FD|nr:porin [Melaminivora sp.]